LEASGEVGGIFVTFAVQTAVISAIMTTAVVALAVIFVFFVVGVEKGISAEYFQDRLDYIADGIAVACFAVAVSTAITLTLVIAVEFPPNHLLGHFSALLARLSVLAFDFDKVIFAVVVVVSFTEFAFLVLVCFFRWDTSEAVVCPHTLMTA
jgi:hypothetical protein